MDNPDLTKIILDWMAIFVRLSMHDFNRFTRSAGLSMPQMNVLLNLYYKGPAEVMAFAEPMHLSPAGASQLVDRMVQQGLVRREESPADRRVRLVQLTDQGRRVVDESILARGQWVANLIDSMNADEKTQVAQALQILTEKAVRLDNG
jgi:DNA-binding MarR family transcriptional regulator